jgi:hypothetical protein
LVEKWLWKFEQAVEWKICYQEAFELAKEGAEHDQEATAPALNEITL